MCIWLGIAGLKRCTPSLCVNKAMHAVKALEAERPETDQANEHQPRVNQCLRCLWSCSIPVNEVTHAHSNSQHGHAGARLACGHCERLLHPLCLHPPALSLETLSQSSWECPSCGEANVVSTLCLGSPSFIVAICTPFSAQQLIHSCITPVVLFGL